MASDYLIQIVHRESGHVVSWAPGLEVETGVIDELCARVARKGVGMWRTQEHVVRDVRAAFVELLMDLKARV